MEMCDKVSSGVLDDNGFLYTVAGGKATIVRFPENNEDLRNVPDKVGGYPVTAISTAAFNWPDPPPLVYKDGEGEYVAPDGVVFDANRTVITEIPFDLEELVIPSSVREIHHCICDLLFLKSIQVEEGSKYFSSVGGMLFNAERGALLAVPGAMTGACWIPASVKEIDKNACGYCPCVTALNVAADNENYCSVDGVVYTRDLAELYVLPDGYVGKLTIPHGVRRVHFGHFRTADSLTGVVIPASVTEITVPLESYWAESLASIDVHVDNQFYRSEDGVLFSKDGARLIRCPPGKTGVYAIPPSVVELDDYAFSRCSYLDRIDVPHQFQLSKDTVFEACEENVCIQHVSDLSSCGHAQGWLGRIEGADGQCYFRAGQFRNEVMLAGIADDVTGDFIIPDTLDRRRVERIMRHAFGFVPNLTSVTIPAGVMRIDEHVFYACEALSEISVEAVNPVFSSYDGCLYDKQMTRLIRCPCGKEGVLKIPATVGEFETRALSECMQLSAFDVAADNDTFASFDDALYDRSLKTLLRVPPLKNGVISMPATLEHFCMPAFDGCDWITYAIVRARKKRKFPCLPVPICWAP